MVRQREDHTDPVHLAAAHLEERMVQEGEEGTAPEAGHSVAAAAEEVEGDLGRKEVRGWRWPRWGGIGLDRGEEWARRGTADPAPEEGREGLLAAAEEDEGDHPAEEEGEGQGNVAAAAAEGVRSRREEEEAAATMPNEREEEGEERIHRQRVLVVEAVREQAYGSHLD